MALDVQDTLSKGLAAVGGIKRAIAYLSGTGAVEVVVLVRSMDMLQVEFQRANSALTALADGRTPEELSAIVSQRVQPSIPDVIAAFNSARISGKAVVVEYATVVWPTFAGTAFAFDPNTGLHSPVSVPAETLTGLRAHVATLSADLVIWP